MKWAVAEGLISGTTQNGKTYLSPQGDATREQVAAILMRFSNLDLTPVQQEPEPTEPQLTDPEPVEP